MRERHGVHTRAQLEREIAKTCDRGGVAVDEQGCEPGVTVVAAAIDIGEPSDRFALSLCGPTRSMPVEPVVSVVRSAAMNIRDAATGMTAGQAQRNRAIQLAISSDAVHRILAEEPMP